MKLFALVCLAVFNCIFGQEKIGGIYELGLDAKKEPTGKVLIHPHSDSLVLFHIHKNTGPKYFSTGTLWASAEGRDGKYLFKNKSLIYEIDCSFELRFNKEELFVRTVMGSHKCGFGEGVKADGLYQRTSKKVPEFFTSGEQDTIYFKSLVIEN